MNFKMFVICLCCHKLFDCSYMCNSDWLQARWFHNMNEHRPHDQWFCESDMSPFYAFLVLSLELWYIDLVYFHWLVWQWVLQGKRGVWIKMPIELVNLVEAAVKVSYFCEIELWWFLRIEKLILIVRKSANGVTCHVLSSDWSSKVAFDHCFSSLSYCYVGRILVSPCWEKILNARVLDSWRPQYYSTKCHPSSGCWCICVEWKRRGTLLSINHST